MGIFNRINPQVFMCSNLFSLLNKAIIKLAKNKIVLIRMATITNLIPIITGILDSPRYRNNENNVVPITKQHRVIILLV
jgi:hypothetical protein